MKDLIMRRSFRALDRNHFKNFLLSIDTKNQSNPHIINYKFHLRTEKIKITNRDNTPAPFQYFLTSFSVLYENKKLFI